jgi:hypothetical protein
MEIILLLILLFFKKIKNLKRGAFGQLVKLSFNEQKNNENQNDTCIEQS